MSDRQLTREDIAQAYEELGHRYGWTFMATPETRLRTAEVAIVGLNPGGGGERDTYAYEQIWDSKGTNAYYDEQWGASGTDNPLQIQVKHWHRLLGLDPADPLCIQFVPFRSPTWASLPEQERSLAFARDLWRWVLRETSATLFVTMGKLAAGYLAELMGARAVAHLPTGWGRQTMDVYDAPSGRRIIAMPHPSRYRIFGRGAGISDDAERGFRGAAACESNW